jgi:hypothetical protein
MKKTLASIILFGMMTAVAAQNMPRPKQPRQDREATLRLPKGDILITL